MIVPLFVPSRWRAWRMADPAAEFGPVGNEDAELVGVVAAGGDRPAAGAASGPDDPAAPAGWGAPPAPVYHGALPHRTPPPGIVY